MTNLSPKSRFQLSNEHVTQHRNLVDSESFERACDVAIQQYSSALCSVPLTQEEAVMGSIGLKLRGAHEFLTILRNLAEKPKEPSPIVRLDNLNHKA